MLSKCVNRPMPIIVIGGNKIQCIINRLTTDADIGMSATDWLFVYYGQCMYITARVHESKLGMG